MGFFSRLAKHEALFRGMTDRLGVNVSDWVGAEGQNAGDYRTSVLSCTACKEAGACMKWQEDHDASKTAPDFCRNKRMVDALSTR
ncbi:DUF6455 family protein [Pseudooceanicola sp. MF1-13]|uniref:DUF6455 family protein n=1 Tax=Pseudooceanicola sp. MF1-13 TaxID=3379095 RepID=UPI0038920150